MILCLTPLAISFINLIDVVLTDSVESCPTDGIHPSLDSCTIYTRCVQGFPFHFNCREREVFDVESKSCVKFKQLKNCYKFDCAKNHKYAVYEGDPSYYALCDKGKAIEMKLCKEGLIFDERKQNCIFKCHQVGIVQHPFDCTMYIECPFKFFKTFWIKRRCPPRSWFHPTKKVCTTNEVEKCAAAKYHILIHNTQEFTLRPERWRKKKKNDIQQVSMEQNDSVQINNELLNLGENTQEISVSKPTKYYRLDKGSSTTENYVKVIEDSPTDYYLKSAEYTTPKTDETLTIYQTEHHNPNELTDSGTNGSMINYTQNSSTLSIILPPNHKSNNVLSTPDYLKMTEESGNFNIEITSEINDKTVNFTSTTMDSLVKQVKVTKESTYSHNFRTTELKRNEKSAKNEQTTNFDRRELSDLPTTNYSQHTSYMTDSDYNLEQTHHYQTSNLNTNEKGSKNKNTTYFESSELTDSLTPHYYQHSTATNNNGSSMYHTKNYDTLTLNTIKLPNDKTSGSFTTKSLHVPTNYDISKVTAKSTVSQIFRTTETNEKSSKSTTFNKTELPEKLSTNSLGTDLSKDGSTKDYTQNYYPFIINSTLSPNIKTNNGSSTTESLTVSTTEDVVKETEKSAVSHSFSTSVHTIPKRNEETSTTTKTATFNQNELPESPSTTYHSHSTETNNDRSTMDYTKNYYTSTLNSTLLPNPKPNNDTSTTESLSVTKNEDTSKNMHESTISYTFTTEENTMPNTKEEGSTTFNQIELSESSSTNNYSLPTDGNYGGTTMANIQNSYTSTFNATLLPNGKSNNSSSGMESISVSTTEDIHKVTYGSTSLYTFTTEQTTRQKNEARSTTTFDQNELSELTSTNYYLQSTVATNNGSTSDYTRGNDDSPVNSKLQPGSETNNSSSTTESLAILPMMKDESKATNESTVSHKNAEYTTPEKNTESSTIVETSSIRQNELTDSPSMNYPPDGANKNNGNSLTDFTQNFNMSTLNSTLSPNDKSNISSSAIESLAVSTTEGVHKVTDENTVSYTYASTENTTPKTNEEISIEPQSTDATSNGDSTTDSMQNYYTSTFQVTYPSKDRPRNGTTSIEPLALPTKDDDGKTDKSAVSFTFRSTEYTTHGKNEESSTTVETTSFHQNELSESPSTPSMNYPSDRAHTNNGDSTTGSTQNNNMSTINSTLPPNDKSNNGSSTLESMDVSTTEKVANESTVSYTYATIENTAPKTNEEISTDHSINGSNNGDSMTDSMQNYFTSTFHVTSPPQDRPSNDTTSTEYLALPTKEDDGKATDKITASYTFRSTERTTHGKNKESPITTETTSFHQNELSESPSTSSLNYPSDGANTNYGDATVNSTQNHNFSTLNSTLLPKDKSNNGSSSTEFLAMSTTEDIHKVTDETTILYTFTTMEYMPPETNEENSKTTFSQNELSMSSLSMNYDTHSTNANNNGDSTTDSTQNYNTSTFNVTFQPKHQPNNDSSTTEFLALPTTVDNAKVINKSSVSHNFRSTEHTTYESSTTLETSINESELSESSTNYNSHATDVSNGSTHYTQNYYPSTLNSTLPPNANYNNGSSTTESIAIPSINYSSGGVNTHNGDSTVNFTQNYNMATINSTLPPNTKSNDDSFTTKSLPISTTEDNAKVTDDFTVSHSFKTTKYTTQKSVENTAELSELSPSSIPNYTSDTPYGHNTGSTDNYPQNYTFSSETALPPSSSTQNIVTKDNICEQNEIGTSSTEAGSKNSPTTKSNALLTLPWIDAFLLTRKMVHSCAQSKGESTVQEHNSSESSTESTFSPTFQTSNFITNVATIGEFKTPITATPVPTVLETTSPDSKEFAIGVGTATTPFSFTTTLDYSNVDYDENMAVTTTFHYDDTETTTISPTSEIAVMPWA